MPTLPCSSGVFGLAGAVAGVVHTRERIFRRLTVDAHYNVAINSRVLVECALERSFNEPGPYVFTLYRGYAVNDEFRAVATAIDQPWLYDTTPVLPHKGVEVFYKIQLRDGNGIVYWSQAAPLSCHWSRYDWTIAREIIRKEDMVLRKKTGSRGFLLKRRLWGDVCTECTDPETLQINNSQCLTCFGTGIVGGYYPPIEYWVAMNATQRLTKLDSNVGIIVGTMETVRALAYPAVSSNDVWVNTKTNQRYLVQSDVAVVASHRGVDLVLDLRLEERGRSDIIYKVPVTC